MTPRTVAHKAPLSMGFSRGEYWSGLSCLPPGYLPDPGIETRSPALQVDSLLSEPPGKHPEVHLTKSKRGKTTNLKTKIFLYICTVNINGKLSTRHYGRCHKERCLWMVESNGLSQVERWEIMVGRIIPHLNTVACFPDKI